MNIENIILEVYEANEMENIVPLSKKQVANMFNKLLRYSFESDEDFKIALEYSVKMRSQILLSTGHISKQYKQVYNYYTSLEYPIRRVLKTMGIIEEDMSTPSYEDFNIKNIKNGLDLIELELKEKMLGKNIEEDLCLKKILI